MMNIQTIKAVIFDLDGTLLDTVQDIGVAVNRGLEHIRLQPLPISAFPALVGHGIKDLFQGACPEGTTDETIQDALSIYLNYYPNHCTDYTCFYPGIEAMLTKLEEAGYQLAILSNKTEGTVKKIVEARLPNTPFQFVWGNNGKRPLKPALDAGSLACQALGLKPEEILFFGDGDTDMEFGSKNGFLTVGCTWGYRPAHVLKETGAHHLVDTPEELLHILHLN